MLASEPLACVLCCNAVYGQLGIGSTSNVAVPTPVLGGLSFASIAASYMHACGVLDNSTGVCWGRNVRIWGLLPRGEKTGMIAAQMGARPCLNVWHSVAASPQMVCAVYFAVSPHHLPLGAMLFAPAQTYATLGIGSYVQSNSPIQISGGRSWKAVVPGYYHTVGS